MAEVIPIVFFLCHSKEKTNRRLEYWAIEQSQNPDLKIIDVM